MAIKFARSDGEKNTHAVCPLMHEAEKNIECKGKDCMLFVRSIYERGVGTCAVSSIAESLDYIGGAIRGK